MIIEMLRCEKIISKIALISTFHSLPAEDGRLSGSVCIQRYNKSHDGRGNESIHVLAVKKETKKLSTALFVTRYGFRIFRGKIR